MANHRYDAVALIALVKSKPCLWDKTNEDSKNKSLRDKSWQEIVECLEGECEILSTVEKKTLGDVIMSKWLNIRDAFIRSLRTKTDTSSKKSYVYAEHLQFLLKVAKPGSRVKKIKQEKSEAGEDSFDVHYETPTLCLSSEPVYTFIQSPDTNVYMEHGEPECQIDNVPTTSRIKNEVDIVDKEMFDELITNKSSASYTDHEIMMLSFVPYIRDMKESELMDLHMDILMTIKKIKQKRSSNIQPT